MPPPALRRTPLIDIRWWIGVAALMMIAGLGWHFWEERRQLTGPMTSPFPPAAERPPLPPKGERSLDGVVDLLTPSLGPPWEKICRQRKVAYPPAKLAFVAFKDTRVLQIYARDSDDRPWTHLWEYPILAASGVKGPKLREGDRQVPEGIYTIEYLNPNSSFHLSLKVSYPNEIERQRAAAEGRPFPGTNIMIHGDALSVGCIAVGDPAMEEIFLLAALAGTGHMQVLIAPRDFRRNPPNPTDLERPTGDLLGNGIEVPPLPTWTGEVYVELHEALKAFPAVASENSTESVHADPAKHLELGMNH